MLVVSSLLVASCAQPVEIVEEAVEVAQAPAPESEVIEEPRVPPTWEQSVSTADFARCKLLDPRPASVKELFRGQKRGDIIGRDNVSGDCRDFTNVFVREGDTLTHGDLRISLEFSAEELDYVTIEREPHDG